jgi:hypothetical protein
LVAVLVLVASGCAADNPVGSFDDSVYEDAAAKATVGIGEIALEQCFADQATYVGCDEPADEDREAGWSDLTATGYTITVPSESGATFKSVMKDGKITRTCSPAGKGGCPAGGTWKIAR